MEGIGAANILINDESPIPSDPIQRAKDAADDRTIQPCTTLLDGGGSHALFLGVLDERTQRLSMKVRHRGLLAASARSRAWQLAFTATSRS
jgi:hypothetical protein